MKKFIFILFTLIGITGFSQNENVTSPKIAIKIALGETITIENHLVKFVKVLEDSRCPKDVTCIWAGRARVQIEVGLEEDDSLIEELIFGQVKQGESKDLTIFTTENKKVIGITLKPYPTTENSGSEKEYQLLVSIEKNEK
jgi:hypothetical protein